MKRALSLILALMISLSLCACGGNTNSNQQKSPAADTAAYVGEWKANVKVSSENEYEVYVIVLNEDGTGSYRDKSGTWTYSAADNTIVLTVSTGTVPLQIADENGTTVLKFYRDTYYRASEFAG